MSLFLSGLFTLLAVVSAFELGRRVERKGWQARLVDAVTDDAGQQWAAKLLELLLRARGPHDPIIVLEHGKKAYTLHHKPDLDVFVYDPAEGSIVHGKTFSKWARRVYTETVRHAKAS